MSKAQRVQPAEQQEDLALKTVVNIVLKKGDVESLTHPSKVLFEIRDGFLPPRERRMMQFDRPVPQEISSAKLLFLQASSFLTSFSRMRDECISIRHQILFDTNQFVCHIQLGHAVDLPSD